MRDHAIAIRALLTEHPVVLAPMEDVSDAPFRRVCRALGAVVCVTEFVRAEQLIRGGRRELRKVSLTPDDSPTGIQDRARCCAFPEQVLRLEESSCQQESGG